MKNGISERSKNAERINYFIALEFILCFFIVYFTVTMNSALASMCFTLSFVVLIVLMFKTFFSSYLNNKEWIDFLLLITTIFIAYVAVLYSGSSFAISFEYLRKYLIFCSTVIFLFVVSRAVVNKKTIKFILIINVIIVLIYLYSYYIGEGRANYGSRYLTLNFSNPNLTAMWLLQTILYIFIAMVFYKSKMKKLFCGVLMVPIIYFLYETESRTSLISLVVYFLLVLYVLFKRRFGFNKLTIVIVILSPIIIAFSYMIMINNNSIEFLDFMSSEGKAVYSRQSVWSYAFEAIKTHPILGAYYQISGGSGMSQMHNTHLDIWASYGTIVFVLLMVYLIRLVIRISVGCTTKLQAICLMAFFAVIIMGMGEAALFSGGQGIYILSCSFLLLARYPFESVDENVNDG